MGAGEIPLLLRGEKIMDCSKITQGLQAVNCGKPPVAGTGTRVILLNYADVDKSLSVEANNVISEILLKSGAIGYAFESLDNTNTGESSYNKTTYYGNWQHDLTMRILVKNEDAKTFVNEMNGARVVAIVENKEMGVDGEVKYEVYGWDAGLELNECTATTEMADGVVYQLKMGSGTNSKESTLPKSVFDTSLTKTEAMLDSLITAG
jgi:hypothetical protein